MNPTPRCLRERIKFRRHEVVLHSASAASFVVFLLRPGSETYLYNARQVLAFSISFSLKVRPC